MFYPFGIFKVFRKTVKAVIYLGFVFVSTVIVIYIYILISTVHLEIYVIHIYNFFRSYDIYKEGVITRIKIVHSYTLFHNTALYTVNNNKAFVANSGIATINYKIIGAYLIKDLNIRIFRVELYKLFLRAFDIFFSRFNTGIGSVYFFDLRIDVVLLLADL